MSAPKRNSKRRQIQSDEEDFNLLPPPQRPRRSNQEISQEVSRTTATEPEILKSLTELDSRFLDEPIKTLKDVVYNQSE